MTKRGIAIVAVIVVIAGVLFIGVISLFTPTPGYYPDLSISMSLGGLGVPGTVGYQLQIDGNGNVSYDEYYAVGGGDFTHEKRTGKITPQQVAALVAAIRKTNIVLAIWPKWSSSPPYGGACDGCSSIDLAFTLNGQSEHISDWMPTRDCTFPGSIPKPLCNLIHQVDGIRYLAVWATPTPGPSPTPTPTLTPHPTATPTPTPPPTNTPPAIMRAGDFGIISQKPCGPPCFLGILPGVTTFDDAALILKNVGVPCEENPPGQPSCLGGGAQIFVSGLPTVTRIDLVPPARITLGEFIARYGPPDSLAVDTALPPLFYDSLQTAVLLPLREAYSSITVVPGTAIYGVEYLTATEYQKLILRAGSYRQPWSGYGTYTNTGP